MTVEGPGTGEGYKANPLAEIRRTRPVWARVPTSHEGPPYAYQIEEREP